MSNRTLGASFRHHSLRVQSAAGACILAIRTLNCLLLIGLALFASAPAVAKCILPAADGALIASPPGLRGRIVHVESGELVIQGEALDDPVRVLLTGESVMFTEYGGRAEAHQLLPGQPASVWLQGCTPPENGESVAAVIQVCTVALESCPHSRDAVVSGGQSPSGRHEIRIRNLEPAEDDSRYGFYLYDHQEKRVVLELSGGTRFGYDQIRLEEARALWSANGEFVALRDRVANHGSSIALVKLADDGAATEIPVPDYLRTALASVHAKGIRNTAHSDPRIWVGNRLHVELGFDVDREVPDFFRFDVVLQVREGAASILSVRQSTARITKPGP